MVDRIDGAEKLTMPTPDQTPADLYNATSAELQRAVDVDPNECLRVALVPGGARTPLDVLLAGLKRYEWRTPEFGQYHEHDKIYHWPATRRFHPTAASAVANAAAVGEQVITYGNNMDREEVGIIFDYALYGIYRRCHFEALLRLSGAQPPFYDYFHLQEAHNKAIDQAVQKLAA